MTRNLHLSKNLLCSTSSGYHIMYFVILTCLLIAILVRNRNLTYNPSIGTTDIANLMATVGAMNSSKMKKYRHLDTTFTCANPSWTQIGNDIDGEATGDNFGYSLDMSADARVMAIGAIYNDGRGHVRTFRYDTTSDSWLQLGSVLHGKAAGDQFGYSVALSDDGKVLAIGGRYNDNNGPSSGHVAIFAFDDSDWVQVGEDIDGAVGGNRAGHSVSLSGDGKIVALSSPWYNYHKSLGHVRVFNATSSGWEQLGQSIIGEAAYDWSGWSISLSQSGFILAIGSRDNDGNGSNSGSVRIYQYVTSSNRWERLGGDIDGEKVNDLSGHSVSLSQSGEIIAVGAIFNDGNDGKFDTRRGHVRVYHFNSTSNEWQQVGSDIDGEDAEDQSGYSVSISGTGSLLAVGAAYNGGNGFRSGHVRVYRYNSTLQDWAQVGGDIDGEEAHDTSGWAVALAKENGVVAIGAPGRHGVGSGQVRVFRACEETTPSPTTSTPSDVPTQSPTCSDDNLKTKFWTGNTRIKNDKKKPVKKKCRQLLTKYSAWKRTKFCSMTEGYEMPWGTVIPTAAQACPKTCGLC